MWVYDMKLQQLLTEMLTLMYTHPTSEPKLQSNVTLCTA
jgi:hypothetical protein